MNEDDQGADLERRFAGTKRLYGADAVRRFGGAHVCVVGIGGVGSWAAEALARSAIGKITLIDLDMVAESNVNRQIHALGDVFGQAKTDAMAQRILAINPRCEVGCIEDFVTLDNLDQMLDREFDYVVDAIDTISAKLTIAKYAQDYDIRLVSSMGGANKLHPECLRFADIFDTVRDPMSRIMRKECKKRGIKSLHVLFSCEESVKTQPRDPSNIHERTELGTASFMPPIMGQMIAGEVIRQISGRGTERVRSDGQRLD